MPLEGEYEPSTWDWVREQVETFDKLILGLLFVVFLPLERLFPGRRDRVFRREYGTDLLFFAGQYLLWNAPVVTALVLGYPKKKIWKCGGCGFEHV